MTTAVATAPWTLPPTWHVPREWAGDRCFILCSGESIGPQAKLKVVKRIVRCAATEVDPDTGIRDLPIPHTMIKSYGHADCGIYGEVIGSGTVSVGDPVVASPLTKSQHPGAAAMEDI